MDYWSVADLGFLSRERRQSHRYCGIIVTLYVMKTVIIQMHSIILLLTIIIEGLYLSTGLIRIEILTSSEVSRNRNIC